MDPRRRGVRFFGLQALLDTMASDDEEAAIPQPTVTKKIVSEIALEQQKKERHADGSGNVVEKVAAPFRVLAIKPPDPSQVQPKAKEDAIASMDIAIAVVEDASVTMEEVAATVHAAAKKAITLAAIA